jgi:outer membrane protein assembly factor BamA
VDTNFVKKRGVFVAFGNTIERHGLFNVTYRLESQSHGASLPFNDEESLVSLLGFALKYDTEDSPFFPTTGSILDFSLETNIFAINEYTKFTKIIAYLKTNFSVSNHHTISPSLFFGAGSNNLPYPENFSFGGQNNFWGFRENQEMGRQMFRLSLEYKYELPQYLSVLSMRSFLSARYDFGSV